MCVCIFTHGPEISGYGPEISGMNQRSLVWTRHLWCGPTRGNTKVRIAVGPSREKREEG